MPHIELGKTNTSIVLLSNGEVI